MCTIIKHAHTSADFNIYLVIAHHILQNQIVLCTAHIILWKLHTAHEVDIAHSELTRLYCILWTKTSARAKHFAVYLVHKVHDTRAVTTKAARCTLQPLTKNGACHNPHNAHCNPERCTLPLQLSKMQPLKGQCHEIFCFIFFHELSSPKPLKITLGSFRFFSKIRGDISKSRCTAGINDTGGKFATSGNDTGGAP
jgi:hypothetical protein